MKIGILGLGEVGSAIKKLVSAKHEVFVRELTFDEIGDKQLDILHICIPFNDKFNSIVAPLIKQTQPKLTIIDATVKPGTTQALHQKTGLNLVHAPIDGVHPHLYEYLFKFTKPIGPVNEASYKLAKKHFQELGVKTIRFNSPMETELAKALSTTYYGWNIIFEKWTHQLCTKLEVDFNQVYTEYNQIYNEGYAQELPNVRRPVLAHKTGEIGGHCVLPNAEILQKMSPNDFTDFLLKQNKKLKKV
jgi:UDP-N-acetyl-D-mannosaminuronate dehydrogenase